MNPASAPCLNPLSNSSLGCSPHGGEARHFMVPCSKAPRGSLFPTCSSFGPCHVCSSQSDISHPGPSLHCPQRQAGMRAEPRVCCTRVVLLAAGHRLGAAPGSKQRYQGSGKPSGVQQWPVTKESPRPSWGWCNAICSGGACSPVPQVNWTHWTSEVETIATTV